MFNKLLIVTTLIISTIAHSQYHFCNYVRDFNKTYSDSELDSRMNIFNENLKTIEQHNSENHSWKMGINKFTDMTRDEFKSTLNKHKLSDFPRTVLRNFNENFTDFPESWDWREHGAVTPVKDQGQCGSCYTFSSTGSIEGAYFIQTGKLVSLSEQQLVDCSFMQGNEGCNGGLMDNCFDYVKKNGICSENDYGYKAKFRHCRSKKCTSVTKISSYVDITPNNENALQQAVYIQPISISACAQNWQHYQNGILDSGECYDLDHGILLVGWGVDSTNSTYWIIKNSWGTSWGEQGYLRVKKNVPDSRCSYGICMSASYPLIN